jgi:Uma2 family endonuclease
MMKKLPTIDNQVLFPPTLPDHTQLPDSDGTFVKNFQEHPQSILLTESIEPILQQLHPDNQYCIGQDCGIYWRLTDPPQRGAECPDWFYVPDVPPTLKGRLRRSYVLWQEFIPPLIVIEFVSGDGSEERDRTPLASVVSAPIDENEERAGKPGKFWIYERVIRPAFYAIYEVEKASVEVYHLVDGRYQLLPPNQRGHYPIEPMGVELGIWQGFYHTANLPWLRWWDARGNLLLTGSERASNLSLELEQERQRAEAERQRAETERQRAEMLAQKLRELGIEQNL